MSGCQPVNTSIEEDLKLCVKPNQVSTYKGSVDPVFLLMRFPLDGELDFYLKMILFIKKMTWSCHLFLFYF